MKMLRNYKGLPLFGNYETGFTLVELLITTSIIILMMGTVIGSGAIRRTQFNLSINQEKVRSLASRAKSLAFNSLVEETAGNGVCGYGVHIERDQAFIFADKSADCSSSDRIFSLGDEELIGSVNKVTTDGGMHFYDMSSGIIDLSQFGGAGKIDVLFVPPDPTTYINGNRAGNAVIGVAFSERDWRKVIIESSGLISVQSY
ncbi:MAG: type II secretion system protein [Candidatus Colwellbacteria bacterium]|nr:type II secretion system protein [Candidatus Colwellbacteria bacterium]